MDGSKVVWFYYVVKGFFNFLKMENIFMYMRLYLGIFKTCFKCHCEYIVSIYEYEFYKSTFNLINHIDSLDIFLLLNLPFLFVLNLSIKSNSFTVVD